MEKIDIAIIGGGVVGLAVASELAREDRDIFIFEKNKTFGQEISSRNSEVIHSGIYYPAGSLKAETCLEGNRLLYEICSSGDVPFKKTGKLIVATNTSEAAQLEELIEIGRTNGVEGLRMLAAEEVREIEPEVVAERAIFLPTTGIIDSHALMEHFLNTARHKGADIVYDAEVVGIEKSNEGYKLTIRGEDGESTFSARVVINCSGLDSDTVSRMAGIEKDEYTLHYCKGDYFRVGNGKNKLIEHLVYPVPLPSGVALGIHATPDLAGGLRLGPDAEYLSSREISYQIDPDKISKFLESVRTFLPFLEAEDLSEDTSGVRPKLQGPGDEFRDFIIKHEEDSGFTGFINLIGIESPGLTASPSIARRVGKIVENIL
ncbi:NAD(P)/FAD-dependent oxidoreductase [Candidatus Omnitrophota bacterium]